MKIFARTSIFCTIAVVLSVTDPVFAQNEKLTYWNHYGSTVKLIERGRNVTISYVKPRRVLRNQGVKDGSVLFSGKFDDAKKLKGEAKTFRAGCLPVSYDVSGKYNPPSGKIVLKGRAPVRAKIGCRIVSYAETGPNAELVFLTAGSGAVAQAPEEKTDSEEKADTAEKLRNGDRSQAQLRKRENPVPENRSQEPSSPDDRYSENRDFADRDQDSGPLDRERDFARRDNGERDLEDRRYDDYQPDDRRYSDDRRFDDRDDFRTDRNNRDIQSGGEAYDHNGSTVLVSDDRGGLIISYLNPSPRLSRQGVRRGDILFEGRVSFNGSAEGTAYSFRRGCSPEPYEVRGRFATRGQRIVLRGNAPIRRRGNCEVIAHTKRGPNALMVLNRENRSGFREDDRDFRNPGYSNDTRGSGPDRDFSRRLDGTRMSDGSVWEHNGSEVLMKADGNRRTLIYQNLRPGLSRLGIRRGTVLFRGELRGGFLTGTAYAFRAGCPPVEYSVEGKVSDDRENRIVLHGKVPIIARGACHIIGYTWDNPNARLVFNHADR